MAGITGTLTRSHIGRCTIVCTCAALLGGMLLGGCAAREKKQEIQIPPETRSAQAHRPQIPELKLPEPAPVIEEISPLKTRIVDVIARNTPLRDVLHVIADATGLNLIMEREVNPDFPVTMTLRNVTAKDALDTIFASVDYFYAIENNMMFIRATDSRVYELGFPAIVLNYSVDVGGDIRSGASGNNTGGTSTGSSSSTSGGSTSSGTNNLRR
jgi:general secretion pathway protein D/MSHA biogenesis protein MshL